jgi:RecB family exonuclease
MNCPLAFYYQNIAKIQIPTKQIYFKLGTAVHKAIEEGIYDDFGDPTEIFLKNFTKDNLTKDDLKEFDANVKMGKIMIENYQKEHPTLDKLYGLGEGKSELYVKKMLKHPIDEHELEVPMSGIIDRLTDSGRIVDYKTSKKLWKEDDLAYKMQTQMYSLWYLNEFDELPEEIVYIILLKKEKETIRDQVIQVLTYHPTIDALVASFEEIEIVLQKINNNEFNRPKGYHPNYCDCYKFEKALMFD